MNPWMNEWRHILTLFLIGDKKCNISEQENIIMKDIIIFNTSTGYHNPVYSHTTIEGFMVVLHVFGMVIIM